ncbi:MAG: DUF3223 domain-containing protein [Patescibacteria group bacterium]|nr:DUF3223 domain-containing protein [Patescibacteria group bacterium]
MTNEKHYPLIRTIYLYLFTLLGLIFAIIGTVRLVDMGLKTFVFTKAEQEQKLSFREPFPQPYAIKRVEEYQDDEKLSEEERATIKQWLEEYKDWKEKRSEINYATVRKHKEVSNSLAFIIVGLPLYLYHWKIIKRETKNKKAK